MSQAFYDYVRGKTEAIPEGQNPDGMRVYRYLVNLGASQMIEASFPLLRAQLGETAWVFLIQGFIRESQWQSQFYGDLEHEFTRYLDNVSQA